MVLKIIKASWFWGFITTYVILGIYLLYIAYANPYLGIKLEEINGQWRISDISYSETRDGSSSNMIYLSEGDVVLSVNNILIQDIPQLQHDNRIREATEIVVKKPDGNELIINFDHSDVPKQFYMLFLFPSAYFLLTLVTTTYLYYLKRHIALTKFLISFLLSVSLAYISIGASGKTNIIGLIINSSCMVLCLVILLHFLKAYFSYLKIEWIFVKHIKTLYILPVCVTFFRFIQIMYPGLGKVNAILILCLFLLLLLYIFYTLIWSYIEYRVSQLKLTFFGLVLPFLPSVFLYVLPEILVNSPIFTADICALFLLLIPFNLIFMQLTDRLFDIMYHITRFRYYSTISLFFSFWLIMGLYLIYDISLTKLFLTALFVFLSSIVFLYIKEKIDYSGRKILFSTKGNNIHKLYQTIDKIGHSHRVEQMLQMLTNEIIAYLEVKEVAVITYGYETETIVSTNNNVSVPCIASIQQLDVGEITKKDGSYIALLHNDKDYKRWLIINHNQTIRLKVEELLWLELLLTYANSFIESTKIIEELIDELHQIQQTDVSEPTWLKKLVWVRVEDEKFQLAQELHDTILQEHLHIARQVDGLKYEKETLTIKAKLKSLHEQMILSINNLRSYCETLKPPLLTNIGLNAALERLFEQTANRAKFKLTTKLNRLYLEDDQLNLVIYRIVQELLNNAIKHSQAESVQLYLQEIDDGFELIYRDNGIGCNVSEVWRSDSMGLQGILDRVDAFNGQIMIDSNMNEGMSIHIKIIERSDVLDFSINSG